MFLKKVLEEIEENGFSSLIEISNKLELDFSQVEFAVDYWFQRGKISKINEKPGISCVGKRCGSCKH